MYTVTSMSIYGGHISTTDVLLEWTVIQQAKQAVVHDIEMHFVDRKTKTGPEKNYNPV